MDSIPGKSANKTGRFYTKTIIKVMNIVNGVLLGFICIFSLLFIASMAVDNLVVGGYFFSWIVDLLLVNLMSFDFSIIFNILEDSFQQIRYFAGVLVGEIVIAVAFNILIKKFVKGEILKIIIKSVVNLIAYLLIAAQIVLLCVSIAIADYAVDVYKKTNPHEMLDFSRETIERIGTFLLDKQSSNTMMLGQIKRELQNGNITIDALNDTEYRNLALNICNLFANKGNVDTEEEHYLRNYFSRAPQTLSEMIDIIQNDNVVFGWKLLTPDYALLHMYGEDGEYNIKFISEDGHFEALYNKDGILLTQHNDPVNMGTFNYADQVLNKEKHTVLDLMPYLRWGNTKDSGALMDAINADEYSEPADFFGNPGAVERYNGVYRALYGEEYL